jgi:adenylosuccinate lyase
MLKLITITLLVLGLAACDAVSTMQEGAQQAKGVEAELEQSVGLKPQVGFNWVNGRLRSVNVMFPRIHETNSLRELTETVRTAIASQFKQTPDQIVVGFVLRTGADGK